MTVENLKCTSGDANNMDGLCFGVWSERVELRLFARFYLKAGVVTCLKPWPSLG